MENNDGYKEVYFDQYCSTCKYKNNPEESDPCKYCLEEPINLYSHKPIKYEKA